MQTKHLILHYSCHRNIIEEIGKHSPDILVAILLLTLLIKSINLCNSSRLMISSGEVDAIGIPDFRCD